MTTEELIELSASARKRKAASFIAAHKQEFAEAMEQATAPLNKRIAELEAELTDCKAQNETLKSQLKALKAQTAKAAPEKAKKGK